MSVLQDAPDLEGTLRERFGLEQFRPGQREVIEHVLQGRDVLCVMPTGGGKSLCYQLPALVATGLTLVVSPLIALMKDQVDGLLSRGIRATLINSTLDPAEMRARLLEIEAGHYDLVYVAPERFRSNRFVEILARLRPAILAVDEAHCISEWGHDFRPDYARIGLARRRLGSPPCIALTATATDMVRRDIAEGLDLRDPAMFVTGFDRPNLHYAVVEARRDADKLSALAEALERTPGAAIVYASSRARCESIAQYLTVQRNRSAVVYHAGLSREERTLAQERFMEGEVETVVATNAFGMGIDKADVRSVVHFNLTGTLEAYYQEAGRAGRDGLDAQCVLLYAPGDRFLQEMFIENEYPSAPAIHRVYDFLRGLDADPIELTHAEIKAEAGLDLNEQAIGTAVKILEGAGAIEKFSPRENMAIVRINAEEEGDEASLAGRLHPQANIQRVVLMGLEGLVNRRLGEPVYFHPDDFARSLGLDRPALNRALRALVAELPIDFVPPFRGNALRVLDRARRPRDIGIDFTALEERKRREYDKLDRMIRYAQAVQCRRAFILDYFGDAQADRTNCGHCDNCGPRGDGRSSGIASNARTAIDSDAGREVILKVLSGVARAKGRFGKTTVAQMLTGSGAEKMDRWGLKRLSTFGILAEFRQPEVVGLLDALSSTGLVECSEVDRFRPVVNLTATGWERLRAKDLGTLELTLPEELSAKVQFGGMERRSSPPPLSPRERVPEGRVGGPGLEDETAHHDPTIPEPGNGDGDPLGDRLRALRLEWAREAKQPPYCIFTNETLEALVRERPRTPQAMAAIKGMGPSRLERHGAALLAAIGACPPVAGRSAIPSPVETARPRPREVAATPSPIIDPPASRAASYVPTEEWTWRLLDRGFTLDEAAAIRGLELSAIVRHALQAARQGRTIPLASFLAPEQIASWDAWRHEHGDVVPPAEQADAPAAFWPLFLACRSGDR